MSVLTAARTVLDDAKEPLPADEIYQRMVDRRLWRNPHQHPERIVAGAIASEIGRHGAASPFRFSADGGFVTDWARE